MHGAKDLLSRLRAKEQRGSKPRCHFLTHGDPAKVARRLTYLCMGGRPTGARAAN
jgi:hypothetical protein